MVDDDSDDTSAPALFRALHPLHPPAVVAVATHRRWRRELLADMDNVDGDVVLVIVTHGLPRFVIEVIKRRRTSLNPYVSIGNVKRLLTSAGWEPLSSYRLWPSGLRPRLAVPMDNRRAFLWAQTGGVLGGGKQMWTRMLLRTRMASALVMRTAGAAAVIARRSD